LIGVRHFAKREVRRTIRDIGSECGPLRPTD
jgi:hypothetical protein